MTRFLMGLAILPFLSSMTFAAQPQPLNDQQMDKVTAGFDFSVVERSNFSTVIIDVNQPDTVGCAACYLNVQAGFVHIRSAFGNVPTPPLQ
jgi:hypothetical protein